MAKPDTAKVSPINRLASPSSRKSIPNNHTNHKGPAMTVSVTSSGTGGGHTAVPPRAPKPPSPTHSSGSESDLLSSASTALRRLHFKSARHARSKPNVPKVVVMGSSTTSDATINTSTESASTLVTTVTADSMDLGGPSGGTSEELMHDGHEGNSEEAEPLLDDGSMDRVEVPSTPDTPLLISKQAQTGAGNTYCRQNGLSTAPPGLQQSTRFPFDSPSCSSMTGTPTPTPRSMNKDVFESPSPPSTRHTKSQQTAFPFDTPDLQRNAKFTFDEASAKPRKKRNRASHAALPDLRVDFFAGRLDLDAFQTCSSPNAVSVDPFNNSFEPRRANANTEVGINVTTNPLDNSVCGNLANGCNVRKTPSATIVVQQASLSLDYGQVSTILLKNESDFVSNVSTMVTEKSFSKREENMKQLLEVTSAMTIEEIRDFEMRYGSPHHSRSQSVKTPGRCMHLSLPVQRSRVASMPNTGTEEEYYRLRHFSITGKGIVNRGDSLKSRRSKSNNSVASSNSSTEHLTAEAKTSASLSLSSRESSTSQPSFRVLMLGAGSVGKSSLISQFMTSEYLHAYDTSIGSNDDDDDRDTDKLPSGETNASRGFLDSKFLPNIVVTNHGSPPPSPPSPNDDSGEKSVSVLLGGEESELTFVDIPSAEMSPEHCMTSYEAHAYCVVYSASDRGSFHVAERSLQDLWSGGVMASRAVILVANKADLVRSRATTTEEGKAMATAYDCKYIETSVGINHNVDELLVGLLSQIRLKLDNPERSRDLFRKRSSRNKKRTRKSSPSTGAPSPPVSPQPRSGPPTAPSTPRKYRGSRTSASLRVKGLLGRVWARDSKSKSCENLHVL